MTQQKNLFKIFLTGLFMLGPCSLILSCMQVDPDAVAANERLNDPDSQTKPDENGRLTLTSEALQISSAEDERQYNRFYIKTLQNVNSVVKEYAFTVSDTPTRYSLNFNEVIGTSCSTNPSGRFFVINNSNNSYTPLSPFISVTFIPGNYRLQFRVENLNCLAITVGFGFKKF